MQQNRVSLLDHRARPMISYLPRQDDGVPWASGVVLLAPMVDTVPLILARLAGWQITVSPEFEAVLLGHGARLQRHSREMTIELRAGIPAAAPPSGVRFVSCDRPAADVQPGVTRAFPPRAGVRPSEPVGEPADGPPGESAGPVQPTELEGLLDGTLVGPLLPCSLLTADNAGVIVAGCLVNDMRPQPWITLMYRDPAHSAPGTGTRLLSAVLARAADDGLASIGLTVTVGNPAQKVYERAGFTVFKEQFTVSIPGPSRVG